MTRAASVVAAVVVLAHSGSLVAQQPTFRSGIELTSIDVTIVDNDGRPIADLSPRDFRVRIDGKERRIASLEWISLDAATGSAPVSSQAAKPPEGYSSNQDGGRGRLIVLAVDQPNIRLDGTFSLREALNGFIDRLDPADRIAAVALGGGPSTSFTSDRAAVKNAVSRMSGQMRPISEMSSYAIGITEARDISEGSALALDSVYARECITNAQLTGDVLANCREQIRSNAFTIDTTRRTEARETVQSMRAMLDVMQKIDGPKTIVVVTEGFSAADEQAAIVDLGTSAADARVSLYVLKLDPESPDLSVSRVASRVSPSVELRDSSGTDIRTTPMASNFASADRQLRYSGPELLASVAKGDVFDVNGTGRPAVERIERELSGYYMIGVESEPADSDGKAHTIAVQVSRPNVIVRTRRGLARPSVARATNRTDIEEVNAALSTPLMQSGLPMRVATFAMRDQNGARIQVLIHADVGSNYTSAKPVTVGYAVIDAKGSIVTQQTGTGRLPPAVSGAPSPLSFSGSVSVDPGDYTFKLAIMEGDRVGSVEHQFHADLIDAGSIKLSELMIGGPIDTRQVAAPTLGYDVRYGSVQGYIEAYGAGKDAMTMRYEIAPEPTAPSLFGAVVPGRPDRERTVFSYAMPVQQLAPGQYFLRASLSAGGAPVKTVARAFRIEPAPAPASSSTNLASARVSLTAGDALISRSFSAPQATRDDTLKPFRDTLPAAAAAAFDAGAAALRGGNLDAAQTGFRGALDAVPPGESNVAALAYLGAAFAAAGNDNQALDIWQVALVDGSTFPQIYEWMSDALVRLGRQGEARQLLSEAFDKWPGETGFAKPLAVLAARDGNASEAVTLLLKYLGDHSQDVDALYLAVAWMADLHAAGLGVASPADDIRLAQAWTDSYLAAGGPKADEIAQLLQKVKDGPARR